MNEVLPKISTLKQESKQALIFGAGKTGIATASFFIEAGVRSQIWDQSNREKFLDSTTNRKNLELLEAKGIIFRFENEAKVVPSNAGILVTSPGISPKSSLFQIEGVKELFQISELELGLQIFAEAFGAKQIIVTGSNGKSTTTALIHHILKALGIETILCGNIGDPIIGKIPKSFLEPSPKSDLVLAVEASSYQLEACRSCRPDVAVMLNLTENHLERHGTLNAYLEAKKNLVRRFDEFSTLVINSDDIYCNTYREGILGVKRKFGILPSSDAYIDLIHKKIIFSDSLPESDNTSYEQHRGQLLGSHNLYNLAAALLACRAMGCNLSACIEAAYKFEGLEHRLELMRMPSQSLIVNDSKATTVSATIAACRAILESDLNRKLILLIGGEEKKGSDWKPLLELIGANSQSFEELWIFGASNEKLEAVFSELKITLKTYQSLKLACSELGGVLTGNNLALLSPGCTSFDEFSDFEERGRFFKQKLIGLHTEH